MYTIKILLIFSNYCCVILFNIIPLESLSWLRRSISQSNACNLVILILVHLILWLTIVSFGVSFLNIFQLSQNMKFILYRRCPNFYISVFLILIVSFHFYHFQLQTFYSTNSFSDKFCYPICSRKIYILSIFIYSIKIWKFHLQKVISIY